MSSVVVSMLMDFFMVTLLVTTIIYCWVLNRRIRMLQDSRSELAQLLQYFDESTQRASDSIVSLQTSSKRIGESIQYKLDKASNMLDDLDFMIERGDKVANSIEAGVAIERARKRTPAKPKAQPKPVAQEAPQQEQKASAPLEAVLERMIRRDGNLKDKVVEMAAEKQQAAEKSNARTQAEQELLNMLKSNMKV